MKSLLLLSIVLASAAANDGPPADDKVIDEIADKDGYDHHDSKYRYCCYEVKKYLENRITNAENRAGTLIDQLRKSIKANVDQLKKMEKKMDDKEDDDYERLQAEVIALTSMVGDLEDGLKHLRGVDKQQHEHLVEEVRRLEERLDEDATKLENELAKQAVELEDLNQRAGLFEEYVDEGETALKEAAADRQRLHNETATLDENLRYSDENSRARFQDLEKKIDDATAKLESVAGKEDGDEAALDSLKRRANETESNVERLIGHATAADERYESLLTDLHSAFGNVTDTFLEHADKINALQDGQGTLKKAVDVAMMDVENNYENIATNAQNITQLRQAVADQGVRVTANGLVTEALGGAVKQLNDKLEALQKGLQEHREHVVEQLKKLTDAVEAK